MAQTKAQLVVGLNVNASAPASALQIDASGNVNLDSNTLYVDATNNRVGIGTSSPGAKLHSVETSAAEGLRIDGASGGFSLVVEGGTTRVTRAKQATIGNSYVGNTPPTDGLIVQGSVGIGTTSPAELLHVKASGNYGVIVADNSNATGGGRFAAYQNGSLKGIFGVSGSIEGNTTSDAGLFAETGGAIRFYTNGSPTEKARIDSSGRLLVGTSSTSSSALLQVQGNSSSSTGDAILQLRVGKNNVGILNGNSLGSIQFSNSESTVSAVIEAVADANWNTTNDYPSRLVFSTTADGSSSPTERMRIQQSGTILIHKTSAGLGVDGTEIINSGGSTIQVTQSGNGNGAFIANMRYGAGTQYPMYFNYSGTTVGTITVTSTATAYNTSSDYRLKENVVPLTGAIDRVNQLQVHRFNFIADPDKTVDGFLAHEAQAVVPECATGTKDEVDTEGNPKYQGIDQSKLVPLLTAALQEALAEIESLKARVTALEP